MFPHEMLILMALFCTGVAGAQKLNRPQDITSEYIGYQYDSLVRRGYLAKHAEEGYRLTQKGKAILLQLAKNQRSRVDETIVTLNQMGIDTSRMTNALV